ncbi:MAG TPA: hypothetical protein VMW35_02845 [Myxococcota bacterium]|jgi:hypothetical protein|nr:hypothetical protein [Myxococcota bacterium]
MKRLACLLGSLLVLAAVSPTRAVAADAPKKDLEIVILDEMIRPSPAHVAEGGTVAFNNDATSFAAVTFSRAIVKDLECKDARPDWSYGADALISMPLSGDAPNLVLPCALKKGKYPFKVRYFDRPENIDNPQRTNDGTLIVE